MCTFARHPQGARNNSKNLLLSFRHHNFSNKYYLFSSSNSTQCNRKKRKAFMRFEPTIKYPHHHDHPNMGFTRLLLTLAFALISLACSVYTLQHARTTANQPALIIWIALSAAISYSLLCFLLIHYLRRREQKPPHEAADSPGYRISRRSNDTETEIPEDTAVNHDSLSTFYYCNSSFAAIHLNSGEYYLLPIPVHTSGTNERNSQYTTRTRNHPSPPAARQLAVI